MDIRTYRARTIHEALQLVRSELGPGAAVLHTREIGGTLARFFPGRKQIEVTASADVHVPSRLPQRIREPALAAVTASPAATVANSAHALALPGTLGNAPTSREALAVSPGFAPASRSDFADDVRGQLSRLQSLVEDLCRRSPSPGVPAWPEVLSRLHAELTRCEMRADMANELVLRLHESSSADELSDSDRLRERLVRLLVQEIRVAGPIQPVAGQRRVVALVGPTGVGKTTTIAKLAAQFRLRAHKRVGLLTIDTYRIAAVEQLKTYAEIIDLPMQVVTKPRETKVALESMADLDLILIDTAGRSPADELKLQELRAFLNEAAADEVHLVLSAVASPGSLLRAAQRFAPLSPTALLMTKLDEAAGLGGLLSLLRETRLPLSYLTDGQNVPDDIGPANAELLARNMLAGDETLTV